MPSPTTFALLNFLPMGIKVIISSVLNVNMGHRPGGSNLHVIWPTLNQNVKQQCA